MLTLSVYQFFGFTQSSNIKTCEGNYYQCKDGGCIHRSWMCDGGIDCLDGTDELNCSRPYKPRSYDRRYDNYPYTHNKVADETIALIKQDDTSHCRCYNYTCSCCVVLHVPKINLNETGCVALSYLEPEAGFNIHLTLNKNILVDETVVVPNPPPLCVGIPYIHQYASVCIGVTLTNPFGACLNIAVKVFGRLLQLTKLGCFYIKELISKYHGTKWRWVYYTSRKKQKT